MKFILNCMKNGGSLYDFLKFIGILSGFGILLNISVFVICVLF